MFNKEAKHSASSSHSKSRLSNDIGDLIDIKDIPTWTKPWETTNAKVGAIDKSYRKNDRHHKENGDGSSNEHNKKSYYAPRPKKSNNAQNYFAGNGKPGGFYVIKKKSQKQYFRKLIP